MGGSKIFHTKPEPLCACMNGQASYLQPSTAWENFKILRVAKENLRNKITANFNKEIQAYRNKVFIPLGVATYSSIA